MNENQKTIYLSNFKQWLEGWDLSIESIDDKEELEKMEKVLEQSIFFLQKQINDWEEIAMEKSNEKLLELFDNPKYKDFQKHANNLTWLRYRIKDLFEIKNRRTKQNFELKSELAKRVQKNIRVRNEDT